MKEKCKKNKKVKVKGISPHALPRNLKHQFAAHKPIVFIEWLLLTLVQCSTRVPNYVWEWIVRAISLWVRLAMTRKMWDSFLDKFDFAWSFFAFLTNGMRNRLRNRMFNRMGNSWFSRLVGTAISQLYIHIWYMHIYLYTYLNMPVLSSRGPASPLRWVHPECQYGLREKWHRKIPWEGGIGVTGGNPAFCATSIRAS